ncbi:MAG: heme-binding sensor globin domain-containing protein [Deltaproteobacteria bacterium]|nr:heme-binding sensor globin domain-containing protein [Deltaproteobacteria bacterium]
MESIDKIKAHYNFTSDDVKNLVSLREVMDKRRGEFVEEFYEYVKNFDNASDFLDTDEVISKHQDAIGQWFLHIFNGEYSIAYFKELEMVGMAHVKINLNAHYVNAAMYFVKRYVDGVLAKEITDEKERGYIARSVDKMLEINLDVMTSSYIAEEKRKIFISQKLEGFMITVAKRFSHGLNIVLVLGLVALGVLAVGLFGYDVSHIFTGENLEESLLTTLGSLLMLWVVIELVDT